MKLNQITILLAAFIGLSSCKKENTDNSQKQGYTQYFNGTVNGKAVDIKTEATSRYLQCTACDVESIAGDWTGFTSIDKEAYKVSVVIADDKSGVSKTQRLVFRVFDIKKGVFSLTGTEDIYNPLSSYALVVKQGNTDKYDVFYMADPKKAPFTIEINKYEYNSVSALPTVGGKLNGTLYNTKDAGDAIEIKDATFEVRY
ncbi:DUF5025 domain-containing protein [Mucilaginibacter conchicola]|uniref:DUF5025 domain-containing protein n=1 Tax=Mucilaginibacter conchicola TaxID=2303333 RepID=A0A372NTH2_9SPHI|nr:DUF5025 domain-containing protein [Mucilaginibacter conchicola]RFZ92201.1 DUF5025 domain-containing protein [Mucilaginibacter conchicola]